MQLDTHIIISLQEEVLSWYARHQRSLPWRDLPFDHILQQRDPYKIMVSEIMSQQTQINRVVPKYTIWIERFPTVHDLANAETSEVLRYWSGLGYNRRAINLQKAAKAILVEHDGQFPRAADALKKLPGIGEYTASAIACFAFNQQVPVIDTNVRKVILKKLLQNHPELVGGSTIKNGRDSSAVLQNDKNIVLSENEFKMIAKELLPQGRAYEWNQALMDYATSMLKYEKIPVPKQSTFKGSNRYFRGQIIKILLEKKSVSVAALISEFGKDKEFVNSIIDGLLRDGMVERKGDNVLLAT